MVDTIEFYKNLPPKQCCKCGKVINEMHECYNIHCEECLNDNN